MIYHDLILSQESQVKHPRGPLKSGEIAAVSPSAGPVAGAAAESAVGLVESPDGTPGIPRNQPAHHAAARWKPRCNRGEPRGLNKKWKCHPTIDPW